MGISVIIPAYGEADNLRILIPKLNRILVELDEPWEIIVVDGALSSDDTESVCHENAVKYIKQSGKGYGDAFRSALKCVNYEKTAVVDADGSQDISKLIRMNVEFNSGADVVIGSRYVRGGLTKDPISSVIMSKILNKTYAIFLGFKVKDMSTDFRIYDTRQLNEVSTKCSNFDVIEEVLFLLKQNNKALRITEVPIHYQGRISGYSKRKLFRFICSYIVTLLYLIRLRISSK